MVKKIALAAAFASAAAAMPAIPRDILIVGGEKAEPGEFPYIVSLQEDPSGHFCGGALVDSKHVVTAAHCSVDQKPAEITVVAGTNTWNSGGKKVGVSKIHVNPGYDSDTTNGDVAVWELESPIEKSDKIDYVPLAKLGSDPPANSTVTIAGWGTTSEGGNVPKELHKVSVPVVDRAECNKLYEKDQLAVTEQMFCAGLVDEGGKDSCQGDSGGPVVDESGTLVGLVSWGEGCARPGYPGVYGRMGKLGNFVKNNI